MAENNEPAAPEPTGNRAPTALPRRRVSAERQQNQPSGGEIKDQLADLVDSVMVLAGHIGGEGGSSTESAPDRSGRRVKKFQRTGTVEDRLAPDPAIIEQGLAGGGATDSSAPTAKDVVGSTAAAANKNVAWPRPAGSDFDPDANAGYQRPRRKRPSKLVVLLAVQVAGVSLLVLGFLAGQLSVPPAAPEADSGVKIIPAKNPDDGAFSQVNETSLQTANKALLAARQGDADGARKLYADALDHRVELPGIYYQLTRLAIAQGDLLDADLNADRSSDAGEFVAACCYTRARFAGMKGNYAEAARQFQMATYTEPFNGRYFFYWGEALRRRGQPQLAVDAIEQALSRAHTGDEGTLYLYKQRLAKVESGADAAFNAELDDHLKKESVTAEWLLLSAARDISHNAFPAAAESLKKASGLLSPLVYSLQVKDYLFQIVRDDPAFAGALRQPPVQDSTEPNGPFTDPVVLPAALADPAIWSVATNKAANP